MSRRRRPTTLNKAAKPMPAVRPEATFTAEQVLALTRAGTGVGGYARPLPRTEPPGLPFGPGVPLVPAPINAPRQDTGRAEPRAYEYPVSWNLPGSEQRLIPWKILRDAADRITLFRRCIEIRKNEVATLDWDITLSSKAIARAQRADPRAARKDIEAQLRARVDPHIGRLIDFWEQPDRRSGLDWTGWAKKALEERFVLDAVAIYPRLTLGGDLYGFEILDGSTIKPLLDEYGYRPMPPAPAFQQILWGFPRGEFVADTGGDDGEVINGYEADRLVYHVVNPRTWTPYGYSAVEQALDDGDLYLRRHAWLKGEYTDGVMPSGWLLAGEGQADWTVDQLRAYETAFNDLYSGQTKQRQRFRLLPYGMQPHDSPAVEAQYRPDYDLMLIKLVAAHFDTTIAELGFTEQGGLGSTGWHEGQADVQDRKATQPTLTDLAKLCTRISRLHLGMPPELEFRILGLEGDDQAQEDEVWAARVASGRATVNEDRDRAGLPRYTIPQADKPFVQTGTGLVFLEHADQQPMQQPAGPGGGPGDAPGGTDDEPSGGPDGGTPPDGGPASGGQPDDLTKADDPAGQLAAAKAAELAAYRRWSRRRTGRTGGRPFEFVTLTKADLAAAGEDPGDAVFLTKADPPEPAQQPVGDEWPAWQVDLAIAAIGATALAHALTAIDPVALVRAWLAHRGDSGTATIEDATHWLESQGIPAQFANAIVPALTQVSTEGFYAGDRAAVSLLTGGPVDWQEWVPGDLTGARHLLSEDGRDVGLHRLLNDAGVTIKRVAATRIGDIAAVLADGLTEHRSPAEMADALRGILDDRAWARMVALTETSRAANAAARDRYEAAGIPATEWMTALDDRVCDICDGNEAAGPVPLGDRYPSGDLCPPAHPHCRCAVLPVVHLTKAEVPGLAKKFNPDELRVPGGEHGGEWTATGGLKDALRLADKIELAPGEKLLGSNKVNGDQGTVRLALIGHGDQRTLRIGTGGPGFGGRDDDAGPWRGGPDRTEEINAEQKRLREEQDRIGEELDRLETDPHADPKRRAELQKRYDEIEEAGTGDVYPGGYTAKIDHSAMAHLRTALSDALDSAMKEEARQNKVWDEIDHLKAQRKTRALSETETARLDRLQAEADGFEHLQYVHGEGSITGEWADVHYRVVMDDDLSIGTQVRLGAVPHGTGRDLKSLTDLDQAALLDAAEARKLVRLLGQYGGVDAQTKAEVAELVKYSPDQPRIPKGQPGGGRFVSMLTEAERAARKAAKKKAAEKPPHIPTGYGLNGPVKNTEPGVHRALGRYHQAMAEGRWAEAGGHLDTAAMQAKQNKQLKTSLAAASAHLASKAPARVGVPHDQERHLRLVGQHENALREIEQREGTYEEQFAARIGRPVHSEEQRAAARKPLSDEGKIRASSDRQSRIDNARKYAEIAATIDELKYNGADREIIDERAATLAEIHGLPAGGAVRLASPQRWRTAGKHGVARVGQTGGYEPYDPKLHDVVGTRPPLGTPVQVVRPGAQLQEPGEEPIRLHRATVIDTTAERVPPPTKAARGPSKTETVSALHRLADNIGHHGDVSEPRPGAKESTVDVIRKTAAEVEEGRMKPAEALDVLARLSIRHDQTESGGEIARTAQALRQVNPVPASAPKAAKAAPVKVAPDVLHHVAHIDSHRAQLRPGNIHAPVEAVRTHLADLKGAELDALAKHYGIHVGRTVAEKRLGVLQGTVGRLADSIAIGG